MDIFDEKLALEKVDGNRDLMLELLGMMISELPRSIAELEAVLHSSDKEVKWNIAHKITGSTAYCGVPALQASARALEKSIKDGDNNTAACFEALRQDAQNLIRYHRENLV